MGMGLGSSTTALKTGPGAGGAASRAAKMRYPTYQPASARPRTTIAPNCTKTFLRTSASESAGGAAFFTGCADLGPSKYSARGIRLVRQGSDRLFIGKSEEGQEGLGRSFKPYSFAIYGLGPPPESWLEEPRVDPRPAPEWLFQRS